MSSWQVASSKDLLAKEWASLDFNGNGKVSLAEIDKWYGLSSLAQ